MIFGYEFGDEGLLAEALTTPSYRMDHPEARDNQRLEFLGDAVLGMMCAEQLYGEFPESEEGPLTVQRTHMVSSAALCSAAVRADLGRLLKRNRHAGPLPDDSKILADAIEAIIGAAYLDGGFEAARVVYRALALEDYAENGAWSSNPKGELQMKTQAMKPLRRPVYTLVATSGPAHEPVFTVKVEVEGCGSAQASARTRRQAEARAAAMLMSKMKW